MDLHFLDETWQRDFTIISVNNIKKTPTKPKPNNNKTVPKSFPFPHVTNKDS